MNGGRAPTNLPTNQSGIHLDNVCHVLMVLQDVILCDRPFFSLHFCCCCLLLLLFRSKYERTFGLNIVIFLYRIECIPLNRYHDGFFCFLKTDKVYRYCVERH